MKPLQLILFLVILSFGSLLAQNKNYNITDYGASAQCGFLNTAAFQKAIDAANENGGGRVVVPSGNYLTGTILLKDNVELHLQGNAVILGSTDFNDYKKDGGNYALIVATGQKNIAFTGEGSFDGQGQQLALAIDSLHHSGIRVDPGYDNRRMRPGTRPNLFMLKDCENVSISGISTKNAANWVLRLDKCVNTTIDGITVDSDVFWNNDGIDLEDCKNVRITNCFVNAADDGICLKSNDPESFNDSIYIANNTIRSSASAIKFGTASHGGFKNIFIENIKVYDTFRSALAFEAVDGGFIENVFARNITATNTGNAIFIRLGQRNRGSEVGSVKNIRIENMVVDIPFTAPDVNYNMRGPELPFFHNPFPASIVGIPGHYVENISLENIQISYPGRANKGYAHVDLWNLEIVPEKEEAYPEFSMFGELPAWAFYVRHVNGLEMKNVRVDVREKDFRPAYVFDDVKQLSMQGGNISSPTLTEQVVIKDTKQADFSNVLVDWKKMVNVIGYGNNSMIKGVNVKSK